MEYDIYPVEVIFPDGKLASAEFFAWEESPDEEDKMRLVLNLSDQEIVVNSDNLFRAMQSIRHELDKEGVLLQCYGANKNVYPSPMIESMGSAVQAYKLIIGRPALQQDLVSIFGTGPDVIPASVEEQEAFYREWVKGYGLS